MTHQPLQSLDPVRPDLQTLESRLGRELSWRDRLLHLTLLLFDLGVGVVVASLLLTEENLPLRTRIAFGMLVAGSLAWAAFFTWTLTRRKVLFARQRLIAGRIALTFSTAFTLGALLIAFQVPTLGKMGLAAALFGLLLVAVAATVFLNARRRLRGLLERRDHLESQLASLGGSV